MTSPAQRQSIAPQFSWERYKKGLLARMLVFAFLGMGWDVLMTFIQQALAGKLTIHALNPASAWMYLAYAGAPLFFYPVRTGAQRLGFPYPLRVLVALAVFYAAELIYGWALRSFGIMAWNYDWNLDPRWTLRGIITWHPVFLVAWSVFVMIIDCLDAVFAGSYDVLKQSFRSYLATL